MKITEDHENKNEDNFKFQVQSVRSQRWFDLDFDCIKENFSTRDSDFYKKTFQRHDETQGTNAFKMFVFPIGNAKNVKEIRFHIDVPLLKYHQNTSNSCCFSSLASAFDSINQIKAVNYISKRIEESLTSQVSFRNCIVFLNAALKNQK